MLQPLYVVGRRLTKEAEQKKLVEMLEGVENDLVIATGYRVKALIEEMGEVAALSWIMSSAI